MYKIPPIGYMKGICLRIWLYSVATNFNIISKEYDNKKDEIFSSCFPQPGDKLIWKGLWNQISPDIIMLVIYKKQIRKKDAILRKKKEFVKEWWSPGALNLREVPGHRVWRSHFYILSNMLCIRLRNWLKSVSFLMNVFHTE